MARRKAIAVETRTRFIADTHFGHELMVTRVGRPFESIEEMDVHMISSWNSVVGKTDHVWHLGDFAFWRKPGHAKWAFDQLNGIKHLVVGNHDGEEALKLPWASIQQRAIVKQGDVKVHLDHAPLREWYGFYNGDLHFHGHTHNTLPSSRRSMDIGVDHIGYTPLTLPEIRARMALLPELDFTGTETDDFEPRGWKQ